MDVLFFWQLAGEGYSRCLCISDGSLLPVMAAKFGFEKVKFFYEVKYHRQVMQTFDFFLHSIATY